MHTRDHPLKILLLCHPPEAMACGLPVIVSAENGTFEIITHNSDGMILNDPTDSKALAGMIRKLLQDAEFRSRPVGMLSKRHESIHGKRTAMTWQESSRRS